MTAPPAEVRTQTELKGAKRTKLLMLGTGAGPVPMLPGRRRFMTLHAMLSNGLAHVLHFGRGVTNEFARTGIELSASALALDT